MTTGSDGTYTVAGLDAGSYTVEFYDPNDVYVAEYFDDTAYYSATLVEVLSGSVTTGIDADLATHGSLSGTVVGSGSAPLAGIRVNACEIDLGCGETTTASDGTYTVAGLAAGSYTVEFSDPSGAHATEYYDNTTFGSATIVTVLSGADTPGIDAALVLTGSLSGTVVGAGSLPLADIEVTACGIDDRCSTATTAADGTYTILGLAPNDYTVEFSDPSGAYATQYFDNTTYGSATLVTVVSGADTSAIDAEMVAPGSLSGTVVGAGSTPLADVGVTACDASDLCETATTDVNGTYTVAGLDPGDYFVQFYDPSRAYASEYFDGAAEQSSATQVTVVAGADTSGIDADLVLSGSITGVVTDTSMSPLDFIEVAVCGVGQCTIDNTDASGTYTFHGLTPGAYTVQFTDTSGSHVGQYYDGAADETSATPVTVTSGVVTQNINAILASPGAISGTVTDANSAPLVGIEITACDVSDSCETVLSTSSGSYSIPQLAPGDYRVKFRDPAGDFLAEYYNDAAEAGAATPVSVVVNAATQNIDAVLAPAGKIAGTVTNAQSVGIEGIEVTACDTGDRCESTLTGVDGGYTIGGLAAGTYVVEFVDYSDVYAGEYFDGVTDLASASAVTVVLGTTTQNVDASLDLLGAITGTVTDSGLSPLAGIEVTACDVNDDCRAETTDSAGSYTIAGLAAGDYQVYFYDYNNLYLPEYYDDAETAAAASLVAVAPAVTASGIDATLTLGGSVSGTVTNENGVGLADVRVSACYIIEPFECGEEAVTDANGTYLIQGLRGGYYDIDIDPGAVFSASNFATSYFSTTIDTVPVVVGTETPGNNAALQRAGTMSGIVTDPAGGPIDSVAVEACKATGGDCVDANTDSDGSYHIGGLESDTYIVSFSDWNATYVSEYYDDAATESAATGVVVVVGSNTPGIDAQLALGGSIRGTVTDAASNPIESVQVTACHMSTNQCRYDWSDEQGSYRIGALAAGNYTIQFGDEYGNSGPYIAEYFDDVATESLATSVAVLAGQQTSGIDAALELGGSIAGTVTDTSGAPVESLQVTACEATTSSCSSTFTNTDGTYRVNGVAAGSYSVRFYSSGGEYVEQYFDNAPSAASATQVVVAVGVETPSIDAVVQRIDVGSLSGVVTNDAGVPLPNILVSACDTDGNCDSSDRTFTGVDGSYRIGGLAVASYHVFFEHPGKVYLSEYYDDAPNPSSATPVAVEAGSNTPDVNAVLALGGSISGTLTTATGDPIIGERVWACSSATDDCVDASTNSDGSYRVAPLPSGSYTLEFGAYSRTYISEFYDDSPTESGAAAVNVTAGSDTPNIDAVLALGGSLSGTVTDAAGAGVAGEQVRACNPATGDCVTDYTDSLGGYHLSPLVTGSYIVRFGEFSGTYLSEYYDDALTGLAATAVAVQIGVDTPNINAALALGGSISGTLTDATGAPAPFTYARVCDTTTGECVGDYTDSAGNYRVGPLLSGNYSVEFGVFSNVYLAEFYDNAFSAESATLVPVVVGSEVSGINAQLSVGGSVSGVITDSSGVPVESMAVEVCNVATDDCEYEYSGPDGSYQVGGLIAGDYTVYFVDYNSVYLSEYYDDAPDASTATHVSVALDTDTPNINATVSQRGSVSGVVTDASNGPIAGITVEACTTAGYSCRSATTGSDGTYRVYGLLPGNYKVGFRDNNDVYAREYYDDSSTWAAATPVAVAAEQETPNINAALTLTGSISGTVTGPNGDPIGGISVNLCNTETYYCRSSTTNSDGTYQANGLDAGDHSVRFSDYANGIYAQEYYDDASTRESATLVPVSLGVSTSNIDAQLAVGGSIRGTVTDSAGQPIAGISVEACRADGCQSASTASDGTYRVGGLLTDSYRVRFADYSSTYRSEYYDDVVAVSDASLVAVTLGAETTGINAALPRFGSASGTVTDSSGVPLEGISVEVCPAGSGGFCGHFASTAADGTYTISGLEAGTYIIRFADYDRVYAQQYYDGASTEASATPVEIQFDDVASNLDAVLRIGGQITGTVTNASGETLADISVEACNSESCRIEVTGADGTYSVTGLATGQYNVGFDNSNEYVSEFYDDAASSALATPVGVTVGQTTSGIDAVLTFGGSVSGLVVDRSGAPLQEISVEVCALSDCSYGRTASDGTYMVGGLRTGSYVVRFSALWYGDYVGEYFDDAATASSAVPVAVTLGTDTPNINATLDRPSLISGTVTDAGGNALSDISVIACTTGICRYGYTDSAGNYSISTSWAGAYTVHFEDRTGAWASEYFDGSATQSEASTVQVALGTDAVNVNASLDSAGSISGLVTTADSIPLAEILVSACTAGECWTTSSRPDGTYSLAGLVAGQYTVLFEGERGSIYAPVYFGGDSSPTSAVPVSVTVGTNSPNVNVALSAGGSIAGTVTVSDGTDPEEVVAEACSPDHCASGVVQSDGTYSIPGLAAGTYVVEYYSEGELVEVGPYRSEEYVPNYYGNVATAAEATPVVVGAGINVPAVDAVVVRAGWVSGQIRGEDGVPIAGSLVEICQSLVCRSELTDSYGQYGIRGLAPGTHTVRFSDPSGRYVAEYYDNAASAATAQPVNVVARTGNTDVDATLAEAGPVGSMAGTITAPGGAGLAGIKVEACIGAQCVSTTTSQDGSYVLANLGAGSYTVEFSDLTGAYVSEFYDDAAAASSATAVAIAAGAATSGIDAELAPTPPPVGSIAGVVTGPANTALSGISVKACLVSDPTACSSELTQSGGSYSISDLAVGSYTVEFSDPTDAYVSEFYDDAAAASSATPVEVAAGTATSGIDAELAPTPPPVGSIAGVVTGRSNAALFGMSVKACLVSDPTACSSQLTQSDGSYSIADLAPGDYVIEVSDPSGNYISVFYPDAVGSTSAVPVTVSADTETTGIDVALKPVPKDDVFAPLGSSWWYSSSGTSGWMQLRSTAVSLKDIGFGDFDGDGYTDVFTSLGGGWWYSSGGTSSWIKLRTSAVKLTDLAFGDFDGDGVTDVFALLGGSWWYSSGGTSRWIKLRTSNVTLSSMAFGDFDGDGVTDVFAPLGGSWWYSSGGTSSWIKLRTSNVPLSDLAFGDFDGDGVTDVFTSLGGSWWYSSGGTSSWIKLRASAVKLTSLRFGDFNGDGTTDVFTSLGGSWWYSAGGTSSWIKLRDSGVTVDELVVAQFDDPRGP